MKRREGPTAEGLGRGRGTRKGRREAGAEVIGDANCKGKEGLRNEKEGGAEGLWRGRRVAGAEVIGDARPRPEGLRPKE